MQITDRLKNLTTIEEFSTFFHCLRWNYPLLGGRRASYLETKGTICLNDFIKIFNEKLTPSFVEKQGAITRALSLITAIEQIDEETARAPTLFRRIATFIRRFFGNFFFNRNTVLRDMVNLLSRCQTAQAIQATPIEDIVLSMTLDEQCKQPLLTPEHLESDLQNVAQLVTNRKWAPILYNKVAGHFGEPAIRTAFTQLYIDPFRFEWLARYVVWTNPKAERSFFEQLNWPPSLEQEKIITELFNGTSNHYMNISMPMWMQRPPAPAAEPHESKK
jgi:hypothetical protein